MSKSVVTTPEADAQISAIDEWWRENREKAPDLFEEELALALRMISATPGVGKRYAHARADVRRVVLRGTRNHVYYIEEADRIVIVAVWGAVKDGGPDLAR